MSISIRNFIKNEIWTWICHNAESESIPAEFDSSNFWIRAGEPGQETDAEEGREIDHFKLIRNISIAKTNSGDLVRFEVEGNPEVLIRGSSEVKESTDLLPDYITEDCPFLLSLLYCARTSAGSSSPIPTRSIIEWGREGALAADIRPYIPKIFRIKISGERSTYNAKLLATLLDCEIATRASGHMAWLHDELCALVLRVPESDHDWLYEEISSAANALHLDYVFLLIYRVFEFLFPMSGVHKLKSSANIGETHLDLLHKCQSNLNWFWKHDSSAKTVARLAKTGRFVEPLQKAGLVNHSADIEDAGSKLVSLRNALAHQAYRKSSTDADHLRGAILSCTMLCSDAFEIYNEWRREVPHLSPVKSSDLPV